jgi:carboxyl-terminal processing protease
MRKRLSLSLCILIFLASSSYSQSSSTREKAIVLKRLVELNHFSPRPVNDSFSVDLFETIINEADSRRLLFTAPEYTQLVRFKSKLDDELNGKDWSFFDLFSSLYNKALTRADSIVTSILKKPVDFSINETISTSKERSFNFSTDNVALTNRWSRYLKFVMLDRIYSIFYADSLKKSTFKEALTKLEPATREKVQQAEIKSITKILDYPGGYPSVVAELYLNAIATCFDPHSSYFSPQEKESFQAQLSTEAFSFGLDFGENKNGRIIIERLTPGGPAWKTGELHKGDELLSLQWEGKTEVDMTNSGAADAYEKINESVHDRLVFKFRKPDGTNKIVLLRKEKINNEENIVKGFVLKGTKKIGYILLPGFYTEWENEEGSSCANDIAKEIVKLKKENIEGLILDVRFNGGGSVKEAIDMIGIFIDEGPLAAEKGGDGKQVTFRDPNRGTIYDGPMALMVNGQSASASEMLAASLQDYNRAVIIGSNTYGKATMQQMFLLDTITRRGYTGGGDRDAAKITIKKLYRLNGQSAQLNGVIPDVILPDAFDAIDYREKFQKFSLPADTAKRNTFYKPLSVLPIAELAKQSATRLASNPDFNDIKKTVAIQRKLIQSAGQTIPLKWDGFEKWAQENEGQPDEDRTNTGATALFSVENHSQDRQLLQNNLLDKEINNTWLQNIAADIYTQEAFSVLNDLIQLKK